MPYLLIPPIRRHPSAHIDQVLDVECPLFLLRTPPASPSTFVERLDANILTDCRSWDWWIRYRFPTQIKPSFDDRTKAKSWREWTKVQESTGTKKELVRIWEKECMKRDRKAKEKEEKRKLGVPVGWQENIKAYKAFLFTYPGGWKGWRRCINDLKSVATTGTRDGGIHDSRGKRGRWRGSNLESVWAAGDGGVNRPYQTHDFETQNEYLRESRGRPVHKRAASLDDVGRISMETASLDGSLEERLEAFHLERLRKAGTNSDDPSSSSTSTDIFSLDPFVESRSEGLEGRRRRHSSGYPSWP